ncbi:MAG: hypothetical protein QOK37_3903 [Thermoanaerobaculia bacterium]|jgi:RHS repeat-associated protein|nr:hypothetical protein [Thermoanaerobaculia bacterium]
MNLTRAILRPIILALVAMAVMSGTALAAVPQGSSYIVILKSRKGPVPDLAKLGGTVTFRQDDQVVVTIPAEGVEALRRDPLVRYVQALDGSPLIGEPEEPSPGAPKKLVPHADAGSLNWSRQYQYDDAGNIININNANDSSTSQEYVYDALGRLHEMATAGTTTESYVYDRYGNQTSRTTPTGTQSMSADPVTNRLALSTGYGYDAAGNVTSGDGYVFAYDALGQAATKTYTAPSTITFSETYIYTAGDERIGVQTSVSDGSSGNWWYWSVRDEGGKVLRQYRSSASDVTQPALWIEDYVYRDGQLVGAERPATLGGRRHYHLDHLGTPRLITSDAGQLVSFHDYLPFGGETSSVWQETGAGFDREDPMKFTGHERDYAGSFGREDGHAIDYMHARYYSGGMGRFLSLDPIVMTERNLSAPERWNRYTYAVNSPIMRVDPDGRKDTIYVVNALGAGMFSARQEAALNTAVKGTRFEGHVKVINVNTAAEINKFGGKADSTDMMGVLTHAGRSSKFKDGNMMSQKAVNDSTHTGVLTDVLPGSQFAKAVNDKSPSGVVMIAGCSSDNIANTVSATAHVLAFGTDNHSVAGQDGNAIVATFGALANGASPAAAGAAGSAEFTIKTECGSAADCDPTRPASLKVYPPN